VGRDPLEAAEALHAVLQDHSSEAYHADLSLLHEAAARRLRQLCKSNGGVYIKAAQLLSTAQTIPHEYRK
jgi:predicted unusual protein kinase regulating ubiquinone biosynthesis (AarF/ABC1/UbiB family)